MIKLVVTNEKNLELYELEKVHVGENKFGYYLIFLPEVLNTYNLSNCEVKLIQVFEDNTSVAIDVDTTQETRPIKKFITLDATAQAQTVTLSVLITHNGDVIGKTDQKTYQVYPTKNFTPIDPREELDEIIAELRADNAQLEEIVSEQSAEITEKTARITELSNQVDDLTEETAEQAETIERQETTIDQLNSRVPKMYTPPIVTPSGSTQQITPPPAEDYDGLASVTVDRVTAEGVGFNSEYYKEGEECLGEVGTYNPFPEQSYGGIYYINKNEQGYPTKILIKDLIGNGSDLSIPYYNKFKNSILDYRLENCKDISSVDSFGTQVINVYIDGVDTIRQMAIYANVNVQSVILKNIKSIGYCGVSHCNNLQTLFLPNTLQTLSTNLQNCSKLEFVTIENGFNCNNLNLSGSILYSHDTILSWFNALADRTGQTAYTLTIGTTNLNKMTAEEKAIATNKNWNLA